MARLLIHTLSYCINSQGEFKQSSRKTVQVRLPSLQNTTILIKKQGLKSQCSKTKAKQNIKNRSREKKHQKCKWLTSVFIADADKSMFAEVACRLWWKILWPIWYLFSTSTLCERMCVILHIIICHLCLFSFYPNWEILLQAVQTEDHANTEEMPLLTHTKRELQLFF